MKAVIIVAATILLVFVLTKAASTNANAVKKNPTIGSYQVGYALAGVAKNGLR
jgi:hypothetical protein